MMSARPVAFAFLLLLGQASLCQSGTADLLLHNGKIVTVNDTFDVASAIVIKDGKILAVGGEDLVGKYKASRVIDLKGREVLPGFTDTHIHIFGAPKRWIDLRKTTSMQQLQQQVRDKAKQMGPGEWVTGNGWDEFQFPDHHQPVRKDLDEAAPNTPVILIRAGAHSCVANSMALKLANVTRSTPDPEHGVIEHDASGELNGVIREANDLIMRHVPTSSFTELKPTYIDSLQALLPMGITSIMVAGAGTGQQTSSAGAGSSGFTYQQWQEIYRDKGEDLPRATLEISYPGRENLEHWPHKTGDGDDRLRIGPIGETPIDGGFTGPTAWTIDHYKGMPDFRGKPWYTEAELKDMVETGTKLGWQMGLHAIGDAAIVALVKAYDEALHKYPRFDHRFYLAHFTVMPPASTMSLMKRDNIFIAQQPNFTYTLEGRYKATLTDDHVRHINALVTPLDYGIFIALGSDNLPIGPLIGLYGAVTRKGLSGDVLGAEERVSMADAIRMYTKNGPYLSWDEKKKGTLEVGKFADMVVWPEDLLTVAPEKLLTMSADMTIVGGKVVYEKSGRS